MKRLENLGKTLNKEEQKKILGGDPPPTAGCECQGSIGSWIYTNGTPTCYEEYQDVMTYCRSQAAICGGGCVNWT